MSCQLVLRIYRHLTFSDRSSQVHTIKPNDLEDLRKRTSGKFESHLYHSMAVSGGNLEHMCKQLRKFRITFRV